MAALMLCLVTVALSLSSCGFFVETFLSEYTAVRTQERDDDEETKKRDPATEALDIETDPPYRTEAPESKTLKVPPRTSSKAIIIIIFVLLLPKINASNGDVSQR